MKKVILLLLISSQAFAQQSSLGKYDFNNFMLIEKVQEQEKQYNEMLQQLTPDKVTPEVTNDYRGELAFHWLAEGNVERYNYYKATDPKFSGRQFLYLVNALEKLFDERKQYAHVAQITNEILEQTEKHTLVDPIGRREVLLELNAAANAKLGNPELAKKMFDKISTVKNNSREIKYFKDSKSNYFNRYAMVMLGIGQYQVAFDTLSKAFREADSNPYLIETLKEAYKKVKGTDSGFEIYIQSLQDEAYKKYYKEEEKLYITSPTKTIEGKMPDPSGSGKMLTTFRAKKPVKEIALQNLAGKAVKLDNYKGRILAIDFWTTLCTPCVSAFAGFERVVADYKNDEFKMFVIDIFETQHTVKAYVAQKGITLDVLTDEENAAYDIQATPTKIVFDAMGNIRFYSSGYAGSTDREYYKLKAMIEIIKARASRM